MKYLVVFILLCVTFTIQAQEDLRFGDTPTTNKDAKYKPRDKDYRQKALIHWVKPDAKGLLIGNKCMDEVTYKMGFIYLVQPKGQPGHRTEFGRLTHNFFAKMGIFFRNGPFWKFKLKKKAKECRRLTGDFMG